MNANSTATSASSGDEQRCKASQNVCSRTPRTHHTHDDARVEKTVRVSVKQHCTFKVNYDVKAEEKRTAYLVANRGRPKTKTSTDDL